MWGHEAPVLAGGRAEVWRRCMAPAAAMASSPLSILGVALSVRPVPSLSSHALLRCTCTHRRTGCTHRRKAARTAALLHLHSRTAAIARTGERTAFTDTHRTHTRHHNSSKAAHGRSARSRPEMKPGRSGQYENRLVWLVGPAWSGTGSDQTVSTDYPFYIY